MQNAIAINEFNGNAGATVWWSLTGNVPAATLQAAWAAHGLDAEVPLPPLPSPEERLGRAVEGVRGPHTLVRPIKRRGAWGVVHEEVVGTGDAATLAHSHSLTVIIQPGQTYPVCSEDTPIGQRILAAFDAQEGLYHRDDISLWLAAVIKRLHGTRLRPRGAPYYLLPSRVDLWRRLTAAFTAGGAGTLYTLPTLAGDEAIAAVLDALTRDVEDDAGDLVKACDGSQGVRALRARVKDADDLLVRLSQYEGLLGGALDAIRNRVVSVQDQVLAAAFAAEAAALSAAAKG